MKKTLITLLALAGVAAADTLTISNADNTAAATGDWFTELSATAINISGTNSFTSTDYTDSFYSVATNVGSGGTYDYVLTFTLAKDVDLSSFSIDFLLHNSDGAAQPVNRTLSYDLTLSDATGTLVSYAGQSITTTTGRTSGWATYKDVAYNADGSINEETKLGTATFSLPDSVFLAAGTEYKLTIANIAKNDTGAGTFVGIGNIAMNVIPEPTTATLSLLALCGLAARRRRASR